MNQIRQRKLKDADGIPNGGKKFHRKQKPPGKIQRLFILTTVITLVVFLGLYTSVLLPLMNRVADSLGYSEPVYAVIIDAGSTGSRVLAYSFHKSFIGGQLVLDDELFHEVKPGLSSYVDNPQQGAQSILGLLEYASKVVPLKHRPSSPLLLRATAGLRLLEPAAADRLLLTVRRALDGSGYRLSLNSVEIMDGQDEGINSWFTVNFLQRRLETKTSAALDLGGGSTQITYEPSGKGAPKPMVSLPGPQRNISLYTYSYLNLGLMAARRGVFLAQNGENDITLSSDCINPIIKDQPWRYANVNYFVSGSTKDIEYLNTKETQMSVSERIPIVKQARCLTLLRELVAGLMLNAPAPSRLMDQDINAFSYYYDRASEAGLIDPAKGGKVTVESFINASKAECENPNVDQPFACLDLTFISVLLQDAFQLDKTKEIELVKKIDGHEISWALGLAYNTLVRDL